jgi:4a-hydroxytetrahydrobiopterin dehydratase
VSRIKLRKSLALEKCQPCNGDTSPLTMEEAAIYIPFISEEWEVIKGKKLQRIFICRNFLRSMLLVNGLAYLAEYERHHPDMVISYDRVVIDFTTHAIEGLSKNDFIMAAKVDAMVLQETF